MDMSKKPIISRSERKHDEQDVVVADDVLFSPSEIYHENSKLDPSDKILYSTIGIVNTSPEIHRIITKPFNSYIGYPKVELPRTFTPSSILLETALINRRSIRQFSGDAISLNSMSKILFLVMAWSQR